MPNRFFDFVCFSVGCCILGSEYAVALGWGIWLIGLSIFSF